MFRRRREERRTEITTNENGRGENSLIYVVALFYMHCGTSWTVGGSL